MSVVPARLFQSFAAPAVVSTRLRNDLAQCALSNAASVLQLSGTSCHIIRLSQSINTLNPAVLEQFAKDYDFAIHSKAIHISF